ncbi:MAG: hypothetical protein LBS27_07595 [Bifidobacteriaceae bacterium]|jgi:xylulokinase|nr:hypothetical protein [Bifidobacteriaceae bacterium]
MPKEAVLALDLGTGGCKASLWEADGACVAEVFHPYPTHHPRPGWSEHAWADWRSAVANCCRQVLAQQDDRPVLGMAVSGHSLGMVLLDSAGQPLERTTPIWSDTRAVAVAEAVLRDLDEREWYSRTGNGFSPALYPLFKARWYQAHRPETWQRCATIIGSKDLVNYWLTGQIGTDYSYASGSGVFELETGDYADDLMCAGGIGRGQLPEAGPSQRLVGRVTQEAAREFGLPADLPVFAGAVDNASMALGSRGTGEGRAYASLGSSSWITVTSRRPVLDFEARPFVFAHALPGHFASALSTFSSGTSMEWLGDLVRPGSTLEDLLDQGAALAGDGDLPVVWPTLSGGTPLEGGSRVRGMIAGLDLSHRGAELARAMMEGIAFSLARSWERLSRLAEVKGDLLISGGGSRHAGWNQLYADIIQRPLVTSGVGQQAAALGAAAIAYVGLGEWAWHDADKAHAISATYLPVRHQAYLARRRVFDQLQSFAAEVAAATTQGDG